MFGRVIQRFSRRREAGNARTLQPLIVLNKRTGHHFSMEQLRKQLLIVNGDPAAAGQLRARYQEALDRHRREHLPADGHSPADLHFRTRHASVGGYNYLGASFESGMHILDETGKRRMDPGDINDLMHRNTRLVESD